MSVDSVIGIHSNQQALERTMVFCWINLLLAHTLQVIRPLHKQVNFLLKYAGLVNGDMVTCTLLAYTLA